MAFVQTALSNNAVRATSLGPIKMEIVQFSAVSADTAGTITSKFLHEIDAVIVDGLQCSAQTITNAYPTASVAITFPAVPVAGVVGYAILFGK